MTSIKIKNVTLSFPIYDVSTRSLKSRVLDVASLGKITKNSNQVTEVIALDNLSLTIEQGDLVGVIGNNGSGKSTLLRVISQVYEPLIGSVSIDGKISALLDFSLGLEPDSTGIENIYAMSAIRGLNPLEIKNNIDDIIDFTGLGEYIRMPLRTYSSGMQLRLAFAIITQVAPDILVLDEVITVGDATFIQKAESKISALIQDSRIVVMASHDQGIIRKICNKIIWLDSGRVKFFGDVDGGLNAYNEKV